MPIIVSNINSRPQRIGENSYDGSAEAVSKAVKYLISRGVMRDDIVDAGVHKISLDARKRNDIHFVSSVYFRLSSDALERKIASSAAQVKYVDSPSLPVVVSDEKKSGRVVIAGFGPAGMFCALVLSEHGYKPIVLERGADVDTRIAAVKSFWSGGELDENTNVQFGEGGAGTFSDGKLTTRISDPLCAYVMQRFCDFGAPAEILHAAKPHIGTDKLREVVKAIRMRVIECGGEVRFLSPLRSLKISSGKVVSINTPDSQIETGALVLAIGHSARDTFEMLLKNGVVLQPKPFSVGARIEHTQQSVNQSLYGEYADKLVLPVGEYQLSHRRPDGRAVYTFCMCPGGYVVASSSEKNTIVTNGMSEYKRDAENANAALVVSVSEKDFGSDPLDGVRFARSIESKAYSASGSCLAPASTVGSFLGCESEKSVLPSYKPGVCMQNLDNILPQFVTDMMKEGIRVFSRKMNCFSDMGAVLTAPETRTSSPVRILRGDERNAVGIDNLYPCGEGAGYAGGIMSAAVDGIKTALKIMSRRAPE